jgi:hypothetical protein
MTDLLPPLLYACASVAAAFALGVAMCRRLWPRTVTRFVLPEAFRFTPPKRPPWARRRRA